MADAEFQALQNLVGPKRVKTTEVEIEAHNPMIIQKLEERRKAKPVTLSAFPRTNVVPKNVSCVCQDEDDTECNG